MKMTERKKENDDTKKRTRIKTEEKAKTWTDVAYRLMDGIFELINSGNILAAVVVLVFLCIMIAEMRAPEGEIGRIMNKIIDIFVKDRFYIFPLLILLSVSMLANGLMYKTYTKEIKRLTEVRKRLIHGIESGNLKQYEDHKSSGFDLDDDKPV
ncbi:MAG: hypothetical protein HQL06_11295 [Nitrospirae bacterium]|nr:hypothetical protein [Nitrospirota bacterium]